MAKVKTLVDDNYIDLSSAIQAKRIVEASETGFVTGLLPKYLRTQFVPNSFASLMNETTYKNEMAVVEEIETSWSSDYTKDVDKLLELLGLDRFLTYVSLSDMAKRNLINYSKGFLSTKGSIRGLAFFKFLAQADDIQLHHWKDTGKKRCNVNLEVTYDGSVSATTWEHLELLIDELFNVCLDVDITLVRRHTEPLRIAPIFLSYEKTTLPPTSPKVPIDFEGSYGFNTGVIYRSVMITRDLTTINPKALAYYLGEEIPASPFVDMSSDTVVTIGSDDDLLTRRNNVRLKFALYSLDDCTIYPPFIGEYEYAYEVISIGFIIDKDEITIYPYQKEDTEEDSDEDGD